MRQRIAITGGATLEQLGNLIRNSVNFDSDHLDRFTNETVLGHQTSVVQPYVTDSEALTDEMTIGNLPLLAGSTLEYLLGFGDHWKFEVRLETIELPLEASNVKTTKKCRKSPRKPLGEIIAPHSDTSEQYPDSW